MRLKRVVITGRGAVSPFGLGVDTLVDNIWADHSAVKSMDEWSHIKGLKSRLAAPVPEFDVKKFLPRKLRRTMGPMAIYGTIAAQEAVKDAGIDESTLRSGSTGVVMGSTTGSPLAYQNFYSRLLPNMVIEQIKSGEFFKMMSHTCSANICLALGITGEQWSTNCACTSSLQAIGLGYLLIQTGRQKVMICGGADEVHYSVTGVFDLIRAASSQNDHPEANPRPFDQDRDGVVCGGGGGVLVLEEYESAMDRNAIIYAEITGLGNVNDSAHIANPHEDAMAKAMIKAMEEAGVTADEIDYVSAHATATENGDKAEAAAIFNAVGAAAPVSSIKGHIGHTLGAAGSLETIILLEMLKRGEVVPTRNLDTIDPDCAMINLVKKLTKLELQTVIKNNFALGGVNTTLVLRRMA